MFDIFTIFGIRTNLRIKKQQKIEQQKFEQWKTANPDNLIDSIACPFDYLDCIRVGRFSYGPIEIISFYRGGNLIIGNFVSIASGVHFLFNANHHTKRLTTYPIDTLITKTNRYDDKCIDGDIVIGDDVWIGRDVLIFSGVTIGKGAIIGAGAIIAKNVPPYAVVVGNPAKIIRYRFPQYIIDKLMQIDYSFDAEFIKEHLTGFYAEGKNLEEFIDQLMKSSNV